MLLYSLTEVFIYLKTNSNTERNKVITDYVVLYTLGVFWRVESYVVDQNFPAFMETEE
jgi:hypothetical protein